MEPVADLGGGGHTRPVPPLLKRKKNVSEHRNVSDLPPPPFETCATLDAGGAPKKRVVIHSDKRGAYQSFFLGLARLSRLARRSNKLTVFVPPPPLLKSWIRPWMEPWRDGRRVNGCEANRG